MVNSKKERITMNPIFCQMKKTQPIQWTKQPTSALVATSSLWPNAMYPQKTYDPKPNGKARYALKVL
jgi:hypothetical protein